MQLFSQFLYYSILLAGSDGDRMKVSVQSHHPGTLQQPDTNGICSICNSTSHKTFSEWKQAHVGMEP